MASNKELLIAYENYKKAVTKSREEEIAYKARAEESLKTINEQLEEFRQLEITLPQDIREKTNLLLEELEDTVTLDNLDKTIRCYEQVDGYLSEVCENALKKAGFMR